MGGENMMKGCSEVEGEKVHILSEKEFKALPYIAKQSWWNRMTLGGFCRPSKKEIVIRETRRYDTKLLCHERGHLRGLKHTWRVGYLMFPYWFGRGWKE